MQVTTCAGCDKQFKVEDCAPYMQDAEGKLVEACRKCIGEWVKLGILWGCWPFYIRKEGKDV